jgi:hypothetical protein
MFLAAEIITIGDRSDCDARHGVFRSVLLKTIDLFVQVQLPREKIA